MLSLQVCVLVAALSGSNDLVLLEFGADWCVPCRDMEPTLCRLEEAGYPVRRVNVDQSPELARRFAVGPIPCMVLLRRGQEVQRTVGVTSYDRLVQMFHQAGHAGTSSVGGDVRGQSPDRLPPSTLGPARSPVATGGSRSATPDARLASRNSPPVTAGGASEPPHAQLTPTHQLALQATVRLRVIDPTGASRGTGTIIDVHGEEALVLTCGHIFRDSQGKGAIEVEMFAPGARGPVAGHLLVYESEEGDYGLVSVRPGIPVTPVRVATTNHRLRRGDAVFSVGCNYGADPTVRVSSISAVDRYVGPPNIEAHGRPVEGRSGGGLFTADGQIIGICNAADPQEDRGIYAALPTIHLALDKIGQGGIYRDQPQVLLADDTRSLPNSSAATNSPPATATISPAARGFLAAAAKQHELICVVRSPEGNSQVIVIRNPSGELLQRMTAESRQRALSAGQRPPQPARQDIAQLYELPTSTGPVVRAQGR